MKLEFNSSDYQVSNIKAFSVLLGDIASNSMVMINEKLLCTLSFELREMLILMQDYFGRITSIDVLDTIQMEVKSGRICVYTEDNEIYNNIKEKISLLGECNGLNKTEIVKLRCNGAGIEDIMDLMAEYGKLENANTITFRDGSKAHCIKYSKLSLIVYMGIIYVVDFGFAGEQEQHRIVNLIKRDIHKRTGITCSVEEYSIR